LKIADVVIFENGFIGNRRDDVANVGQIGNLSLRLTARYGGLSRQIPESLRMDNEVGLHFRMSFCLPWRAKPGSDPFGRLRVNSGSEESQKRFPKTHKNGSAKLDKM
jgi:hypothetical protein